MSQDKLIRLRCATCKNADIYTTKNKKSVERKIELKKLCANCGKHTKHKEAKITG